MSEPVSALNEAKAQGFAQVAEQGLKGMIAIRCDLGSKSLAKVVKGMGLSVPAQRRIVTGEGRALAWMSPDELLLLCDYADASGVTAQLAEALAKEHALVTDVSDARALFRVSGEKADQVLMKLCPVDFEALPEGEMRRTRAAQVAAAIWRSGAEELSIICFRSVAGYMMGLLEVSARQGGEIA